MSAALSELQLRTQADAVRRRYPNAGRIGFHTAVPWNGPARLRVGDVDADIVFCGSALAVREALICHESEDRLLLLLTDREEADLGDDVLARLATRKLVRSNPWRDVMALFRARQVDPRLPREHWLAQAILDAAPPEGPPPAASGVLDAELAWGVILRKVGFPSARPDARELAEWALDETKAARFRDAAPVLRSAVTEWIGHSAGDLAAPVLFCVEQDRAIDALAIGLACRVLFDPSGEGDSQLRDARIRLEPLAGVKEIEPALAAAWADAAEAVTRAMRGSGREVALSPHFDRTLALLDELRVSDQAWRSSVVPIGFEQRLDRFAAVLERALASSGELARAEEAGALALAHDLAAQSGRRGQGVAMALRLARWLAAGPDTSVGSLGSAVTRYASSSSFVDWAREALSDSDTAGHVSAAYETLVRTVTQARERENQQFAELLASASGGATAADVLPVESVLKEFAAPLAQQIPVLLLVCDGMSAAVFQELAADLVEHGWCELARESSAQRLHAIAALPTLTEISRTSLLCGSLCRGAGSDERAGFAVHPELVAASRAGREPLLFHKDELLGPGGSNLTDPVRAEIAGNRRVVGVVINAIDDFLAKGDELHARWGIAAIRPLASLLEAARAAGRAVVFTSDHGHVLERGALLRREAEAGARFRPEQGIADEGEIALRGPRVLGVPSGSVIAAWSEQLRYGAKRNGYHGGVSPQEVVVPVATFTPAGATVEGWLELAPPFPAWWEADEGDAASPVPVAASPALAALITGRKQFDLPFAGDQAPRPPVESAWIGAFFASPIYGSQKRLAARSAPPDDRVKATLLALGARGGKLTRAALARAVGLPPVRIGGFLAALRRVLNVEGYPVLTLDDEGGTVELNRELLIVQFGIDE